MGRENASVLRGVVTSEDVQERDEWDDHGDAPREPRYEPDVAAAEDQVDPDQHDRDRVENAEQELDQFLHRAASVADRPASGRLRFVSTGGREPIHTSLMQ